MAGIHRTGARLGNRALPLALLILAACGTTTTTNQPTPRAASRVVGYYYGATAQRGFPVSSIRGDLLTHINYAFGFINTDGTAGIANPSFDTTNFAALRELKQRYPHLQVLVSFGGWTGSKNFSDIAATPEMRSRFAQSFIDVFLRAYPGVFDGVDLDWEYPTGGGLQSNTSRPEDRQNLTALVEELRRRFDEYSPSKHLLITAAIPAGQAHIRKYEVPKLAQLMDFINMMSYDFHTGERLAQYNAPLDSPPDDPSPTLNIKASVAAWTAAGIPSDKLVIGVPFYGYGYYTAGRFQAVEQAPADTTGRAWTGALTYRTIAAGAAAAGFERHYDDAAHVPWLYNPATRVFITYDDPQSLREKAEYVRAQRLGGIMIWQLAGDDGSLLPAIVNGLR